MKAIQFKLRLLRCDFVVPCLKARHTDWVCKFGMLVMGCPLLVGFLIIINGGVTWRGRSKCTTAEDSGGKESKRRQSEKGHKIGQLRL